MRSLKFLYLASVLLLSGCRTAKLPEIATVSEEIECMTYVSDVMSEKMASGMKVDNYAFQWRFYGLVHEYVWDCLQYVDVIPEPTNVKRYFSDIPDYLIALEGWDYDGYSETCKADRKKLLDRFHNAIELLHKYSRGRLEEYPAKELVTEIDSMLATIWMMDSEGMESAYMIHLLFRLLQQSVRFCPDIAMLCDHVSNDGRIGIYDATLRLDTYQPCFNPVFMRGNDDKWTVYMKDMFLPNRAYRIEKDDMGYCIMAKAADTIGLRGYDEFGVQLVVESQYGFHHEPIDNVDLEDEFRQWLWEFGCPFVLFNPDPDFLTWTACEKKGEYYHRIPGSPILKLSLSDIPHFEMIYSR